MSIKSILDKHEPKIFNKYILDKELELKLLKNLEEHLEVYMQERKSLFDAIVFFEGRIAFLEMSIKNILSTTNDMDAKKKLFLLLPAGSKHES